MIASGFGWDDQAKARLGPGGSFHQAVDGSDSARVQSAATGLSQALASGASELLRPLNGVLQTEAKGALGEQVRSLTNPDALPAFALGVAGVGAAARVVDPAKIAREISPDVARKLGLPWPLDADKLTPEQVAKLKQLGQDESFLESLKDSAKSWTWSDIGHTGLDVVGFVPGFGEAADVANAAWYVAEANYLDAGLSLVSVIPVVGDVIGKGGKLAKRLGGEAAEKVLQALKRVDVVKFLDQFKGHPKLGPYVAQIQEAVGKWVDELKGLPPNTDGAARPDFSGKLRGQDVTLPRVHTRRIEYVKRSEAETAQLRAAFDGRVRASFLQDLATDPAKAAQLKKAGSPKPTLAS